MNIVLARFGNQLSQRLYHAHERLRQWERLLSDRPTDVQILTRTKSPQADLKSQYRIQCLRSAAITATAMVLIYAFYPEYYPTVSLVPKRPISIVLENIPETHQNAQAPAPPRPQVPLAVEGEDVPDDVTIESTELDFDSISDISMPTLPGLKGPVGAVSDEPIDYTEIDYKPHPIRIVTPEYPEEARKKRIEGKVMVKVLVDKEGNVERVDIVDGPAIFRNAALSAASQFRFRPGKHAGERRKVWMTMPIEFLLK